ncbi:MAG: methyltransferase domain-containing protein [Bacteroidetes bacterium]|nr:methyltransferase domain-containing protein [Bacteroidota bacterium]
MSTPYVCPATYAGSLDNFLRRMMHKPEKILSPFLKEGMTALDMGCGPGFFTVDLARLVGDGGRVIAADLQQEMLDKMFRKGKQFWTGKESRAPQMPIGTYRHCEKGRFYSNLLDGT